MRIAPARVMIELELSFYCLRAECCRARLKSFSRLRAPHTRDAARAVPNHTHSLQLYSCFSLSSTSVEPPLLSFIINNGVFKMEEICLFR